MKNHSETQQSVTTIHARIPGGTATRSAVAPPVRRILLFLVVGVASLGFVPASHALGHQGSSLQGLDAALSEAASGMAPADDSSAESTAGSRDPTGEPSDTGQEVHPTRPQDAPPAAPGTRSPEFMGAGGVLFTGFEPGTAGPGTPRIPGLFPGPDDTAVVYTHSIICISEH